MSAGLPPIDPATLPADIRNGSSTRRQSYEAGLSFERQLVQQLTTTMAQTTKDESDAAGDSGDAASQTYQQMIPDALTDAVMSAGGLGLARQLMPPQETKR
jgi:hypothetical protein